MSPVSRAGPARVTIPFVCVVLSLGSSPLWASPPHEFDRLLAPSSGGPPLPPLLIGPEDGATGVSINPRLQVLVSDPEEDSLTVTLCTRRVRTPGSDFTIVMMPDTQYYTAHLNGGTPEMFQAQTRWIMDHQAERNIVYAGQLGDIVENEDYHYYEWHNANDAMSILEDSLGGALPDGLPWDVTVGDHDQTPRGDPDGATFYYNWFFGPHRFEGRSYYGGHYGYNNDNHYTLFSGGGLDFIAVSFEFDFHQNPSVLAWADSLLTFYSSRHAILLAHFMIHMGGEWESQGRALYYGLRHHPNLFLMLCAHISGQESRTDTHEGRTVHTLLANYQNFPLGGEGYMRLMRFSPASNCIRVQTYSPYEHKYLVTPDSTSQFTLGCDLGEVFENLGERRVASGSECAFDWEGRQGLTQYEWSINVSDGDSCVAGPTWRFTTGPSVPLTVEVSGRGSVLVEPPGLEYDLGSEVCLTATPDSGCTFKNWEGDASGGANPLFLLMDAPKRVVAVFAEPASGALQALKAGGPALICSNPLRPGGVVSIVLPREMPARLSLVDVTGRRVSDLVCETLSSGRHELHWDGRIQGRIQPAGVYFLRLEAPGSVVRRAVTVIR